MNILTFDIEEWYIEQKFHGGRKSKYVVFDDYLHGILDLLDERNFKATFFCIGQMATFFPEVIKAISSRGHEIGCHSNEHLWLTKMTPDVLRKDTKDAIARLEDISGNKVLSYRAPAFSIGEKNNWAFEVLAECGIERDSSIYPTTRDFGGYPSFPSTTPVQIIMGKSSIKEFPIPLCTLFNKRFAYSGGGYFRLFPYWFIKKNISKSLYGMTYFHIGDLLHKKGGMMSREDYETYFKEQGTLFNRMKRYFKSGVGTKGTFDKMTHFINDMDFVNLAEADGLIERWNKVVL